MKRTRMLNLSAAFGLILFASVWAHSAPTNDNFFNAQLLSGVNGTFVGTNVDATKQVGEPYHFGNLGGSSVWYKFVAPGNGVLHFATSNTNFDTVVGVYTGTSVGNLTLVSKNDNDELSGWMRQYSRVYAGTQAGQTYYIAVDGKNSLDGNGALEGQVAGNYSFENLVTNDNFGSAITLATGNATYSITTSNVGASKESGEPNHMNNPGGKSVWFNYSNDVGYARRISLAFDSARLPAPVSPVKALISVYTGNTLGTLTPVFVSNESYHNDVRLTFLAAAHSTYHIAIDGYDDGTGSDLGTFTLSYGVAKDQRVADFDEDGKADLAIYRPTEGRWYSRDSGSNSMRVARWGANGDKPLLSKDTEGTSLYTVFRPDTGIWYVFPYSGGYSAFQWGMSGDKALIFDWSTTAGTTKTSEMIFRPVDGTWWIHSGTGGGSSLKFGQQGDIPMLADFDGDGTDERTVFRPSNGTWYFLNTETNQTQTISFGASGDIPVPADYDADGIADVAIFRPSTGDWWFRNAQTGAQTAAHFGQQGDEPQPADYDGDGSADLCVFRNGAWWILKSSNGSTKVENWGAFNDLPLTAPSN